LVSVIEELRKLKQSRGSPLEGDADHGIVPEAHAATEEGLAGALRKAENAGDLSGQPVRPPREPSDFSAELREQRPSRDVSHQPNQVAGKPSIVRRLFRSLARFSIAVLIGVAATLLWQSYGNEAKELVRTWVPSVAWLLSAPKTKFPANVDVAAEHTAAIAPAGAPAQWTGPTSLPAAPAPAAASDSAQQLEAIASDLAAVRRSLEDLTAKQQQMAQEIATLHTMEQDIKEKVSPPTPSQAAPVPPHRPQPRAAAPPPRPSPAQPPSTTPSPPTERSPAPAR
jgi:hypothetical protein